MNQAPKRSDLIIIMSLLIGKAANILVPVFYYTYTDFKKQRTKVMKKKPLRLIRPSNSLLHHFSGLFKPPRRYLHNSSTRLFRTAVNSAPLMSGGPAARTYTHIFGQRHLIRPPSSPRITPRGSQALGSLTGP